MGGLTCWSPCCLRPLRQWRNCARGRSHARAQADADAGANHARWQQGDGPDPPTFVTLNNLIARDDIYFGAKQKPTRCSTKVGTH